MISVCMATYNGERFIEEQIRSILDQLSSDDELVISDDGSTDCTLDIIKKFDDPRIVLYNHEYDHGVIQNFNNALTHARGEYIFLADQDDVWLPGRVQKVMDYLKKDYALVLVNAKIIDKKNETLHNSFFQLNRTSCGFWRNLWKNGFLGCCMAFRRNVLSFTLPFPRTIPMHDWWIGLQVLAHRQKYIFLADVLHAYRKHGNNQTDSGNKSHASYWTRLKNRLLLLLYIAIKYRNI